MDLSQRIQNQLVLISELEETLDNINENRLASAYERLFSLHSENGDDYAAQECLRNSAILFGNNRLHYNKNMEKDVDYIDHQSMNLRKSTPTRILRDRPGTSSSAQLSFVESEDKVENPGREMKGAKSFEEDEYKKETLEFEQAMTSEIYPHHNQDEESIGSLSISSSMTKIGKPVAFISWDGLPKSRANVEKLKRFLHARGCIMYEHSGESVTQEDLTPRFMTPRTPEEEKKEKNHSKSNDINDDRSLSSSHSFAGASKAPVIFEIIDKISLSSVFVSCVSKEYAANIHCKKLAHEVRRISTDPKLSGYSPTTLFMMMEGDFTTDSLPHNVRNKWVGHMLKDSLWSPGWNHAHLAGASETIMGVINLRRNVIKLNSSHVKFILTRGKQGIAPPFRLQE